jgi:selenocysteine lyase/cysteine desulfurase
VEFLGRRLGGLLDEAREPLAAYVGTQANQIVFVENATFGVNIVARSLLLEPGDEVLATDHEYGASDRTWRFLCAQRGGQMCAILLPDGDATTLQQYLREEWNIEIPVISWHSRRLIRLSLQGYNGPADVDRLLTALNRLFPRSGDA